MQLPYSCKGRAVTTRARMIRSSVAAIRRNEVEPPSESTCHGTTRTCGYHAIVSFPVLGRGPVDDLALDWQLHENLKSAADATMQRHRAAMRRCDCIHDRKSECGPLGIAHP
jgi:hypothetical protein